jgi:membrane-associated phospholipid phosphatase
MTQRTQPIWKSLAYTTAGCIVLFPSFAHWCFSEIRAKLADWDETLSAALRRPAQRRTWRWISRLGDGWLYVLVWWWNKKMCEPCYVIRPYYIAVSCFLAWGIGSALKILVRRRRQNPIRRRVKILNTLGSWSFPSQHAAVAVAFACALPNPFTIALATAICISRVLTGAHYLGDVVAGVAVGLVAGRLA